MAWAPSDDAHWHIELRCGDCGHVWERTSTTRAPPGTTWSSTATARDPAHAQRLDRERMAAEVETFAAALSRDLIEPADFAA